jgi:phage terminase Nu1 subunit (DNA packaging protein)
MIEIKTKHFQMNIESSEDIDSLEKEVREINKLKRQAIEDLDKQKRLEFSAFMESQYQQWLAKKELGLVDAEEENSNFNLDDEEDFYDKEN